jgi:hypothetical protein
MSPLNDNSSALWRFVFRMLMLLMIALCCVVIIKIELMQQRLSGLATSQKFLNDSVDAMSKAQADTLKKLLAASDKRTSDEACMAVSLLAGQQDLRTAVQNNLDDFTHQAEQRVLQNNADADRTEKTALDFKNQLDGFQVWLSQQITALQNVTQATHAKLREKIVSASDVAPVYHENRLLKQKAQQLEKKKEPSFKLGPIQF